MGLLIFNRTIPLKLLQCLCLFILSTSIGVADNIIVSGLFKDKAVISVNGKRRLLSVGQSSPEGITLISANTKKAVLEINGQRNTYSLNSRIVSNFKKSGAGITVPIAPDNRGMYLVGGSINGFQVNFLVDTGATLVSMNRNHAKRIGIDYKKGEKALSSTASGLSKVYIVNLETVAVGDISLHDVKGSVHDSDFPHIILLGNTFLGRVKINREGQILKLESRSY